MRLKLPSDTPPGTYHGRATVGELAVSLVVHVAPCSRISVTPPVTSVSGHAGERVTFEITVSNDGNTPIVLPTGAALDLDDDREQTLALGRALRAKLGKGERRVDRFFEELRSGHGGEGQVTVLGGAGPLKEGASRTLRCHLAIPESVKPGRTYSGGWEISQAGHLLIVDVAAKAPRGRHARSGRTK